MSINFEIKNEIFELKKLQLPSRFFHFNEGENYVKLLNIGEGIFPKDRIKTDIKLINSSSIVATESATKVYPSKDSFGLNSLHVKLIKSNLEFINDELILFKNAKFISLLKIESDSNSTFFYTSILSRGRSFERFDFKEMVVKNSFTVDAKLEYLENFSINGDMLKDYISRHQSENTFFAKVYIKIDKIDKFLEKLHKENFYSFAYSKQKKLLIGVINAKSVSLLKKKIFKIWKLYRVSLGKKEFYLGKQ
jgi:urease accessory protein